MLGHMFCHVIIYLQSWHTFKPLVSWYQTASCFEHPPQTSKDFHLVTKHLHNFTLIFSIPGLCCVLSSCRMWSVHSVSKRTVVRWSVVSAQESYSVGEWRLRRVSELNLSEFSLSVSPSRSHFFFFFFRSFPLSPEEPNVGYFTEQNCGFP